MPSCTLHLVCSWEALAPAVARLSNKTCHLQVDGPLSVNTYLSSAVASYQRLHAKSRQAAFEARSTSDSVSSQQHETSHPSSRSLPEQTSPAQPRQDAVSLASMDFCIFHAPYHKIVRKAFAWLCHVDEQLSASAASLNDSAQGSARDTAAADSARLDPEKSRAAAGTDTLTRQHSQSDRQDLGSDASTSSAIFSPAAAADRAFQTQLMQQSEQAFAAKVRPCIRSLAMPRDLPSASLSLLRFSAVNISRSCLIECIDLLLRSSRAPCYRASAVTCTQHLSGEG